LRPGDRVVISLPLDELWDGEGVLDARRAGWLGREDIRVLLRQESVALVVAEVGQHLRWIDAAARFAFWKTEASPHLCSGDSFTLDDYLDGYCYAASEWLLGSGARVIVLERHH
jgi:hypothetical protein